MLSLLPEKDMFKYLFRQLSTVKVNKVLKISSSITYVARIRGWVSDMGGGSRGWIHHRMGMYAIADMGAGIRLKIMYRTISYLRTVKINLYMINKVI